MLFSVKRLVLGLIFWVPTVVYADSAVLTLQHRVPEELVPILSPFLSQDGVIKPFENQLIIQTDAENLATLKKLVQDLDKPVQKLMLSVSQSKEAPSEQFSVDAKGKVIFGEDNFTLSGQVSTTNRTSREENQSLNHIQVVSGMAAMITSGKTIALLNQRGAIQDKGSASLNQIQQNQSQKYTVPTDNAGTTIQNTGTSSTNQNRLTITNDPADPNLPSSDVIMQPVAGGNVSIENSNKNKVTSGNAQYNLGGFQEQYQYDNLESGVIVTPTLIGNQVRLDILMQNEVAANTQDHNIQHNSVAKAMQKTKTVMEVPLGEWVYVGGNQADGSARNNSTSTRTQSRDASKMSIWLRVDKIGE